MVRCGGIRRGIVWYGFSLISSYSKYWSGVARCGMAWNGSPGFGTARFGTARFGMDFLTFKTIANES